MKDNSVVLQSEMLAITNVSCAGRLVVVVVVVVLTTNRLWLYRNNSNTMSNM